MHAKPELADLLQTSKMRRNSTSLKVLNLMIGPRHMPAQGCRLSPTLTLMTFLHFHFPFSLNSLIVSHIVFRHVHLSLPRLPRTSSSLFPFVRDTRNRASTSCTLKVLYVHVYTAQPHEASVSTSFVCLVAKASSNRRLAAAYLDFHKSAKPPTLWSWWLNPEKREYAGRNCKQPYSQPTQLTSNVTPLCLAPSLTCLTHFAKRCTHPASTER